MSKQRLKSPIWKIRMILEYKIVMPLLLLLKRLHVLLRGRESIRINIGGGNFIKPGWLSMDYHSQDYPYRLSLLDYNFDLTSRRPLPFADNSVDFFYSQHTLEHIPQEYCPFIFAEMHRCLKPGGAARVNMPDFDAAYDAARGGRLDYFRPKDHLPPSPAMYLIERFATGLIGRVDAAEVERDLVALGKEEFADRYAMRVPRDPETLDLSNHINWWNYAKLERLFKSAGFSTVYKSAPQQSRFPEMRGRSHCFGLEKLVALDKLTGFDSAYPNDSVYAEAVK